MAEFSPKAEPRKVTVAATQMACSWDIEDNMVRAPKAGERSRTAAAASAAATRCFLAACLLLFAYPPPAPAAMAFHTLQEKAEKLVRDAAAAGANIILLQVREPPVEAIGVCPFGCQPPREHGSRQHWASSMVA